MPLDERCGMGQRFMVSERERMTAFIGARMVPAEVETLVRTAARAAVAHGHSQLLTTV